jgi:hypothetical protein
MDIRKRLIAPCARITTDHENPEVDLGGFALNLLLFEKYILKSVRLLEIPHLVRAFGYDATRALLKSNALDVKCDARTGAQIGQSFLHKPGPLPLLSYSFTMVRPADREKYIHDCLNRLKFEQLSQRQVIRLKSDLAGKIVDSPVNAGVNGFRQFIQEVGSNALIVKAAVAFALSKELGRTIAPSDFLLHLNQTGAEDFRTETDICQRLEIDEKQAHKLVERGILAVSGLDMSIEEMETHTALSGVLDSELPIFEQKLDFLIKQITPNVYTHSFQRVLEITGLPDLSVAAARGSLNLMKLLELRETRECKEFRDWLPSSNSATDEEIKERFAGLRAKLSGFAHSGAGKVVRLLTFSGIGLVPSAGIVLGIAAGALDIFLLEKILPQSGPVFFLGKLYPSIFRER